MAGVEPFLTEQAELQRRRADGCSGGLTFTYRDPETATDVRRAFPWAERLIVLAHPYLPAAGSPGPGRPGTGRVARFATADHYRPLRDASTPSPAGSTRRGITPRCCATTPG